MSTKADPRDLAVQLTMKSRDIVTGLHTVCPEGNVSVRLVSLSPEFIAFGGMRSGNRTYQDCYMQGMKTIQIVKWNCVCGFCLRIMKELLNGIVNGHNCVYWATGNPRVTEERAVNLPCVSVARSVLQRTDGPFCL
jgi:hypothetical protein